MKRLLLALTVAVCLALVLPAAQAEEIVVELPVIRETVVVDDGRTDDLAEEYINRMLYPQKVRGLLRAASPGSRLEGADRLIYNRLRSLVAQVAAGELESTEFSFSLDAIMPQVTFTAEELGVEAIFYLDEAASIYRFTPQAMDALSEKVSDYSLDEILSALMDECPYELYWYDKPSGTDSSLSYSFSGSIGEVETATIEGTLTFSMSVAGEYALGEYRVNPAYGQKTAIAAKTAQGVVAQNAALSDYERLCAYRDAICEMVSYNNAAAIDPTTPYGNPWQLIWVFDDDPDTNVVCEGYAKAFKYLNDLYLGSVSASGASVILVTGAMDGGNHMWNIVTMDDGGNYLADVTNCDAGMVGYPDRLFLVGNASGSVADGYTFQLGGDEVHYSYKTINNGEEKDENRYSVADRTLTDKNYLDNISAAPEYTCSASRGYVGYQLAVRLDAEADSVRIRETGEEIACEGRYALIPLSEAGEMRLSLAAVRDGRRTAYGEELIVTVAELGADVLALPEDTRTVEAEAFRGVAAAVVQIPDGVETIGAYAFADNAGLLVVELGAADIQIEDTAFANCPNMVCSYGSAEQGFEKGLEFLVK